MWIFPPSYLMPPAMKIFVAKNRENLTRTLSSTAHLVRRICVCAFLLNHEYHPGELILVILLAFWLILLDFVLAKKYYFNERRFCCLSLGCIWCMSIPDWLKSVSTFFFRMLALIKLQRLFVTNCSPINLLENFCNQCISFYKRATSTYLLAHFFLNMHFKM